MILDVVETVEETIVVETVGVTDVVGKVVCRVVFSGVIVVGVVEVTGDLVGQQQNQS